MRKLTEVELSTIIGVSMFRDVLNDLKPSDKYQFIDISKEFYLLFKFNGVKMSNIVIFDTIKEMENYVLTNK